MKTLIETAMSHLASWLLGLSAVVVACAQLTKARTAQSKAMAKTTKPSAKRVALDSPAPAASLPITWRQALWQEVRLEVLLLALLAVALTGIVLENPPITLRLIVLSTFNACAFFFTLASVFRRVDRLAARWRD